MSTFYNKMKYVTYAVWLFIAIVVGVLVMLGVNFVITVGVAMILGFALNYGSLILMVKIENDKNYISKDIKNTIKGFNHNIELVDSFVFVNAIDMLCKDASNTKIVKIIVANVEKGKEKNRYTYYIDCNDDSMNDMVNQICDYKKVKLYSYKEFERELELLRKNKVVVYFNSIVLAKLLSECNDTKVYDNCIILSEFNKQLPNYKNYNPYLETIYQTNGLVEDKTHIMLEYYMCVLKGKEVIIKDLLSMGEK